MASRTIPTLVPLLATSLLITSPLSASETQTFSYDALGRLVQVARSGTVNSGTSESYTYDPASNRTNVTVAGGGGGGTVYPSFLIGDASITEGGLLAFTVAKTSSTSASFSVNYATANGTAVSGTDYTAGSGTLTFPPATTSLTVSVQTIDDLLAGSNKTITVNLSAASGGATIVTSAGTGTIIEKAAVAGPSFAVGNITGLEGTILTFTVTRSGTTTGAYTVNYATANGTGVAGSAYTATSGTLSFASGMTSLTVPVTTIDDGITNWGKTFYLDLSSPSAGATITTSRGTATATDAGG